MLGLKDTKPYDLENIFSFFYYIDIKENVWQKKTILIHKRT